MKIILILLLTALLLSVVAIGCKKTTYVEYNIDRNSCNGCGECIRVCPNDAISFDAHHKAVIDQTRCTKCGKCVLACPNSAIY